MSLAQPCLPAFDVDPIEAEEECMPEPLDSDGSDCDFVTLAKIVTVTDRRAC